MYSFCPQDKAAALWQQQGSLGQGERLPAASDSVMIATLRLGMTPCTSFLQAHSAKSHQICIIHGLVFEIRVNCKYPPPMSQQLLAWLAWKLCKQYRRHQGQAQ